MTQRINRRIPWTPYPALLRQVAPRSRGRPPRVPWLLVKQRLENGAALWEIMGEYDVCQQVIRNAFHRYGWPLSLIQNAKHNMTTRERR